VAVSSFTKPKTQKSVRTITVSALAVEALRHTHCALRLMNKDNVFVIAADMRTSVAMISSTYGHVPRAVSQASSDKLAQLLYGT
jgi:hypothetical protein